MSPRRKFIRDASAYGGKLSTGDRPNFTRPAGELAWFDGDCGRCDEGIQKSVHQIVNSRAGWIHVRCASGFSDE